MKCKNSKLLISRYIDSDLSGKKKILLENHLQTCAECNEILKSYTGISLLLVKSFSQPELTVPVKHQSRSEFTWTYRIAALIVLSISVVAGLLIFSDNRRMTAQISEIYGNQIQPLMNAPLGALTYYQTVSGETVQLQFTSNRQIQFLNTYTSADIPFFSYKSPLFNDTTVLSYREQLGNTYLY